MEPEESSAAANGAPPMAPPQKAGGLKKFFAPLAAVGAMLAKFKFALIAIIKFLPAILKTGGTMALMIWVYTLRWGWQFALGFVLLIFVHEIGHLLVAKKLGLKVSAPMFIPFVGALIMLRESPRNAWIEAQVGIGGPILGTVGATVCGVIYHFTGNPFYGGLANAGFLINLFNLTPIGFLDGGRITAALSPWLWVVGSVILLVLMCYSFSPLLLVIFLFSLPRLFSLFRSKTPEQARYFEVTPAQRWKMAALYFGLILYLVFSMIVSDPHVTTKADQVASNSTPIAAENL